MDFVGILLKKTEEREGDSQNGHWKAAQFLLETVGMYPKKMVVDVRDGAIGRIAQFDALVGKTVRIEFDVDATEYNGRWYNRFYAYRIADYAEEKAKQAEAAEAANKPTEQPKTEAPAPSNNNGDDLPF